MTLSISFASREFALQVTDRLVTINSRMRYDEFANKNVTYIAKNAVVTLCYTGVAYIDGITTDRWIAEKLWGDTLMVAGRLPAYGQVRPQQLYTIDTAVLRLQNELRRALSESRNAIIRSYRFQIGIVGWRLEKSRLVPFATTILKDVGRNAPRIERNARRWYFENRSIYFNPEGRIRLSHVEKIKKIALVNYQRSADKAADLTDCFVRIIREIAAETGVVGKDCLVTLIPNPGETGRKIAIDFKPYEERLTHFEDTGRSSPRIFSPFIIHPNGFLSASNIVGSSMRANVSGWDITISGPTRDDGEFYIGSQRHPPPR